MGCEYHNCMDRDSFYGECLDRLERYILVSGFKFNHDSDLLVPGRIFYGKKLILINEPCAGCAVLVLLHEIGHMFLDKNFPFSRADEDAADIMGRVIGRGLGFNLETEWENELANHRDKFHFNFEKAEEGKKRKEHDKQKRKGH